jgi:trehalose 6-phosphate phosphatase
MGTEGYNGTASRIEMQGDASIHAFFFDIDGTLVDIADTPDCISADPWLLDVVRRLNVVTGGALALISGRPVVEVDRLFAPMRLAIAGQHGAERRDAAGELHYHPHCAEQLDDLRRCILDWAGEVPGLLVEDKGMSIAVHYRQAPQLAGEVQRVLRECLGQGDNAFRLQEGKMVLELKPVGRDKGTAIIEFMDEAPFRGRTPIFVGDDATDEHGFAVVNNLGGHSVKVGPEPSAARWRIPDVMAVRAWLEEILGRPEPPWEDL